MTETDWLVSEDPEVMLATVDQMAFRVSDRKLRLLAVALVESRWPDINQRHWLANRQAEQVADGELSLQHLEPFWYVLRPSALEAVHLTLTDMPAHKPLGWRVRGAHLFRDVVGNPWRSVIRLKSQRRCNWCNGSGHRRVVRTTLGCPPCDGRGYFEDGSYLWLTPTVQALAQAAYEERPGRVCVRCGGKKVVAPSGRELAALSRAFPGNLDQQQSYFPPCPNCDGTGRVEDGPLDSDRLAVLADALEEAGCENEDILQHLRGPGPHVRGCWVVDLVLGKS